MSGVVEVPCNGCVRCCIGDAVRILPHEDASQWKTESHPYAPGQRMLAHQPTGECVYLGEQGCTIYDYRPQQCRTMDCRRVYRGITWTQARKVNSRMIAIWKRGRELAHQR